MTTIPNNFMEVSFSAEQLLGYHSAQYRTALQYKLNRSLQLNTGFRLIQIDLVLVFHIKKIALIFLMAISLIMCYGTHQFNFGINF